MLKNKTSQLLSSSGKKRHEKCFQNFPFPHMDTKAIQIYINIRMLYISQAWAALRGNDTSAECTWLMVIASRAHNSIVRNKSKLCGKSKLIFRMKIVLIYILSNLKIKSLPFVSRILPNLCKNACLKSASHPICFIYITVQPFFYSYD